jgi:glycosyltransferase involved in cell wall biosynthesis
VSADRLSIGMFSAGWPPGDFQNGVVTYVSSVRPALEAAGHQVTVFARHVRAAASDPRVVDVGALVRSRHPLRELADNVTYRVAPARAKRGVGLRAAAEAVARANAQSPLHVLEIEESFGLATDLRRVTGIPVCVRLHGPWFLVGPALGVARDRVFDRRVREEGAGIAAAQAVTAPSRFVLDRTRERYGISLPDAVVIQNPVTPVGAANRWQPGASEPGHVLFVGRFDRVKGGDLIVQAFARVASRHPEAKLTIAGGDAGIRDDSGRRFGLREYVDHVLPGAMAAGRVRWVGHVSGDSLGALRRASAVCVVPSRYETFPYTLTEAMAAGCPVVAAAVGGIPEIVSDGRNGLLHRSEDVGHLADRILELVEHPEHAAAMAAVAASDTEHERYPDVIASRLVEVYRGAADRGGGR